MPRTLQEMFRQGDRERALGQPISPLMDRVKGGVTKSQTGFFNIVALPLFTVRVEQVTYIYNPGPSYKVRITSSVLYLLVCRLSPRPFPLPRTSWLT